VHDLAAQLYVIGVLLMKPLVFDQQYQAVYAYTFRIAIHILNILPFTAFFVNIIEERPGKGYTVRLSRGGSRRGGNRRGTRFPVILPPKGEKTFVYGVISRYPHG
jgi:hypothetical protein